MKRVDVNFAPPSEYSRFPMSCLEPWNREPIDLTAGISLHLEDRPVFFKVPRYPCFLRPGATPPTPNIPVVNCVVNYGTIASAEATYPKLQFPRLEVLVSINDKQTCDGLSGASGAREGSTVRVLQIQGLISGPF